MNPEIPVLTAVVQYAVPAFLLVIALVSVFLYQKASAYFTVKIGFEKTELIKGYAMDIVKYLMQSPGMKDWQSVDKKEYAMRWLIGKAEEIGFALSNKLADVMVEAAYATAKYLLAKAS